MRRWISALANLETPSVRLDRRAQEQDGNGSTPVEITDAGVRAALAQILQSTSFQATPRSRRFLSHVVDETLAGRGERIKAFTIATDVFGRGSDFDAHADPIVRLEAGRLRRALDEYYSKAGRNDPIVISIPKGGYIPSFEIRSIAVAPAEKAPGFNWRIGLPLGVVTVLVGIAAIAWFGVAPLLKSRPFAPALPRLVIQPFEDLTDSGDSRAVTKGLNQEIIGQISKFKDITAVEGNAAGASDPAARYVLAGNVSLADDRLRLQMRVLAAQDHAVLWAHTYEADFKPSEIMTIEKDIARQIATTLGQPYGIIFTADSERAVDNAPDDWAAYACTLSFYAYRANLDAKTHPVIRKCLEDAVARFPDYATAWALLSQTYIDEIRFHYPIDPSMKPASLERAMAAARRAVHLDSQNIRGLQSEMLALYFAGQIDAALAVGDQAMAANPNDTELIGEFGSRLAVTGHWDRGCGLLAQAHDRDAGPLGYYEAFLSVCAYIKGDYQTAAMWIRKSGVVDNPGFRLISAAVFAEAGLANDAAQQRDWLMANARSLITEIRNWPVLRNARPVDRERFIASLRKAGLPVGPGPQDDTALN